MAIFNSFKHGTTKLQRDKLAKYSEFDCASACERKYLVWAEQSKTPVENVDKIQFIGN